jgi:hypothetical protein
MALYDGLFAFVNGQLLAENTSLEVSVDGDSQAVMTTVKQYAGESPSPKITMVTFENVVPVTGFEIDIVQKFLDSEEVELMLQFGGNGKKMKSKGVLLSPKVSSGVGKTTTLSFGFRGTPGKFE